MTRLTRRRGLTLFAILALVLVSGRALTQLPSPAPAHAQYPDGGQGEEEESETLPSDATEALLSGVDVAVQGLSGGFSPKTVADSVDIVVDAAPSIKANIDNVKAYTKVYGPLIRTTPKPKPLSISERFWRGAARVIFFWD